MHFDPHESLDIPDGVGAVIDFSGNDNAKQIMTRFPHVLAVLTFTRRMGIGVEYDYERAFKKNFSNKNSPDSNNPDPVADTLAFGLALCKQKNVGGTLWLRKDLFWEAFTKFTNEQYPIIFPPERPQHGKVLITRFRERIPWYMCEDPNIKVNDLKTEFQENKPIAIINAASAKGLSDLKRIREQHPYVKTLLTFDNNVVGQISADDVNKLISQSIKEDEMPFVLYYLGQSVLGKLKDEGQITRATLWISHEVAPELEELMNDPGITVKTSAA